MELFDTSTPTTLTEVVVQKELLEIGTTVYVGGSGIQRSLLVDESRPIAYVGYESEIRKLDYTYNWPPTISSVPTSDLQNDWLIRSTLSYS